VRRSGIKARIIGNTAEKLLDRTSADILTLS
jgi:nucleotide-binding universal stress UspA family protein